MPLVSYAVARRTGAVCTSHRTPQLTVPLKKYNGVTTLPAIGKTPVMWRMFLLVVALWTGVGTTTRAQRVTGPWEDATIAPRRVLRIGIVPQWEQWKERLAGDGTREALGAPFAVDSLGRSAFPFLAGFSPTLETLTGLASPPLSFGTLDTHLDVTQVRTDISLEYGLTPRLGLQALIPYLKNRVHVRAIANGDATNATMGFNPARSVSGARQQNSLVVAALGAATAQLSSELTRCAGSADLTCAAINANRAGATSLVQLASEVSTAIGTLYGTPSVIGGMFVPVAGSGLNNAVNARLTDINAQFRSFLGAPTTGEWIGSRPVAAVPIGAAGLDALLGNEPFGISARPLSDYEHSHIGDIEVGAKFKLLDTFGPPVTSALPKAGALRVAVAGIYRLPTGQLDLSNDFTDVGTGDRQPDLEVRGYGDLAIGPRLWVSTVARYGLQRPDRLVRRITDTPGQIFPELAREQEVDRDLGDVIEFEVAPRYVPNDEFSVSGRYRFRSKGADSYSGTFSTFGLAGPLALDASTLGIDTEQKEHQLGFAVTYSTLRGYSRGSAKWPLEISFLHTMVFGGSNVPRLQMNGIGLRVYRGMRK